MKKVLLILANGFEEVEALTPADYLRRTGAVVTLAGLDGLEVRGSHGITVRADALLAETPETGWDAVVLPGGMPGAANLAASADVMRRIAVTDGAGGIVGAICASPALVLAKSGVLTNRRAVCYPGMEKEAPSDICFLTDKVLRDGNIITARGAGCAQEFAFELVSALFGADEAQKLKESVVF